MKKYKYTVIEFFCTECKQPYYTRPCDVKKLKTTLCRHCMLIQRSKTQKMRDVSRANGKKPKSEQTRKKLSEAQKKYWTTQRRKARSGSENPSWNNGQSVSSGGYIYKRCPGHPRATKKGYYVFEHILVMEKHLGRFLQDGEVIHHINGDKTDNRIENLCLYANNSEHQHLAHGDRK